LCIPTFYRTLDTTLEEKRTSVPAFPRVFTGGAPLEKGRRKAGQEKGREKGKQTGMILKAMSRPERCGRCGISQLHFNE
jgi:hypothetical protein